MRILPVALAVVLGLAACAPSAPVVTAPTKTVPTYYEARSDVGPNGEPIEIHAVRQAYLTDSNRRQRVAYNGPEAPGTIVVDPYARFLYHVLDNGEAMRFGIAVGQAVRTSLIVVVVITLCISLAVYGASGNFNLSG